MHANLMLRQWKKGGKLIVRIFETERNAYVRKREGCIKHVYSAKRKLREEIQIVVSQ